MAAQESFRKRSRGRPSALRVNLAAVSEQIVMALGTRKLDDNARLRLTAARLVVSGDTEAKAARKSGCSLRTVTRSMQQLRKLGVASFIDACAIAPPPHRPATAHKRIFAAYESLAKEGNHQPTNSLLASRAQAHESTVLRVLRSPKFSPERIRLIELLASLKQAQAPPPDAR